MARLSPDDHARDFAEGYRKIGNDGNLWEIRVVSNGTKRWMRSKSNPPKRATKSPKRATKSAKKSAKSAKKSAKRATKSPKRATKSSTKSSKRATKSATKSPKRTKSPNAIKPMLAHSYNEKLDQTGKLASEKLDGVRAIFWNGVFYSRNNNKFNAPAWFIKSMPKVNVPLDGELYTKRGDFHNIMSIVSKNKPVDSEWKKIKYMVFDIIDTGSFTERFNKLKNIVKKAKYIYVVPHIKVKSKTHLKQIQKTVLERGGEGLMLRDPDGVYVNSRSNGLLKVKTFRDAEAVVVKPHLGSGKYNNVMGKLEVHWFKKSKSNTFFVGSGFTDTQRKAYKTLFKPGTIIKVKFFELNESGKPRFPTFIGVRSKKDL